MSIFFRGSQSGIGDQILFSTTVEEFARQRGEDVHIVNPNWRNLGVRALWDHHPFVSSIVESNHTHMPLNDKKLRTLARKYENNIMAAEAYFDLEPQHTLPKMYLPLKYEPRFKDKILVDTSAYTVQGNPDLWEKFVTYLCNEEMIEREKLLVIAAKDPCFYNDSTFNDGILPEIPRLRTENIYEYANAIFSTNTFLCMSSGSAALASAIKNGHNESLRCHVLAPQALINQRVWVWKNLSYYPTGVLKSDWEIL